MKPRNLFEQSVFDQTGTDPRFPQNIRGANAVRLRANDVSEQYAIKNINGIEDVFSFMVAALAMRELGGNKNIKQANRIEQMCLLHPRFGTTVKKLLEAPLPEGLDFGNAVYSHYGSE